eukprot:gene23497-30463_t
MAKSDGDNRRILLSEERSEPAYGNYDGDQIYGIAPVKLALSAGRRNITELLIQSNMELSQKKDEDSVREIIALAQKLGVSTREFSKHDLNMLSDNRPHQGFVLRAKPLHFEKVGELEQTDSYKVVLALDEVWDPQNFGALLRTSFFLG